MMPDDWGKSLDLSAEFSSGTRTEMAELTVQRMATRRTSWELRS
jgi:hypothetical protein